MNYLIQRGKVRNQVINVPEGLPELLSDITRECLRCQPTKECLCQFIMDYLHSVIIAREKALVAKAIIDRALRKVDEIISDMCICDITKEKADDMARVMEECFRRFLEKRRCERGKEKEIIRFDEEDLLDELIKKCKFSEDDLKVSRPVIEDAYNRFVQAYMSAADNTDGMEALYQYFRERELKRWEEKIRNEAATKIQAGFRGYMVRRSMIEKMLPKLPRGYKIGLFGEVPSELYREMDIAARKIQRFFKDHFPSISHMETLEEEGEVESICSHHSKETLTGEAYPTAPDQRPVEPTAAAADEQTREIETDSAMPAAEAATTEVDEATADEPTAGGGEEPPTEMPTDAPPEAAPAEEPPAEEPAPAAEPAPAEPTPAAEEAPPAAEEAPAAEAEAAAEPAAEEAPAE